MAEVRALLFDVFGTVVDWRGTIIKEGQGWRTSHRIDVDCAQFADDWRGGYQPALDVIRRGIEPWVKLDVIHRRILDDLLDKYQITGLNEADRDYLNHVWHRLDPWPDAIAGLLRLRSRYIVATLSNGNVSLLTNMAKRAGLPWDCILSSELAQQYKPQPDVYLAAADLLDLEPSYLMMVAAHQSDLDAAAALGFQTAFVHRPLEYGPSGASDRAVNARASIIASDFLSLADQLGV